MYNTYDDARDRFVRVLAPEKLQKIIRSSDDTDDSDHQKSGCSMPSSSSSFGFGFVEAARRG